MRTADLAPQSGSKDYEPETGVANERRCDHARHERDRRSVLGVESARKKPRAPRTGSATVVARRGHSDPFISGSEDHQVVRRWKLSPRTPILWIAGTTTPRLRK
jgi:hypothetical protein